MLGRNDTSSVDDGEKVVFRKKLVGETSDVKRRYDNLLLWDKYCRQHDDIFSPLIIRSDYENKTLVYEYIEAAKDIKLFNNTVLEDNSKKLLLTLTEMLAKINSIKPGRQDRILQYSAKNIFCNAIDKNTYCMCSGGELEFISILQHDSKLLETAEKHGKNTEISEENIGLCHGDIRFDQFLPDKSGRIWITDFEECHFGDITDDLAYLIGSIMADTLFDAFSFADPDISNAESADEEFKRRCNANIDVAASLINSVYDEYCKNVQNNINTKEISFKVGKFIFERILSRTKLSYKMSEIDKAVAGVARQLIINPEILAEMIRN